MKRTPDAVRVIALNDLVRKAGRAHNLAPGPYSIQWASDHHGIDEITDANGARVVVGDSGVYPPRGPVAEHVAANSPDVTIALVSRIRELEIALGEALDGNTWPDRSDRHRALLEKGAVTP